MTYPRPSEIVQCLGRPINYFANLAKALGINEAIFVGQLLYWSPRGSEGDGWVFKTMADIEDETALTKDQQMRLRKHLRDLEILEEKEERIDHRFYYRLNLDALDKCLAGLAQFREVREPNSPESGNPTSGSKETQPRYVQRVPSEITSEIKTPVSAQSALPDVPVSASPPKKHTPIQLTRAQQIHGLAEFWREYPNHRGGPVAAEKAWISGRCWEKADGILGAVREQKTWEQWQKDGGVFVPMAQTWLHQKRWLAHDDGKIASTNGHIRKGGAYRLIGEDP